MRSGRPLRPLLALVVSGLLLGAAGCTADAADQTTTELTRPAADAVRVAASDDPTTRSVQVSRALFALARGAVVAPAGDERAVATAVSAARRAHVPLLVTPAAGHPAAGERTAGDDGPSRGDAAVAAELERLGADWYQAEGDVSVDTEVPERDAPDAGDAAAVGRASRPATVVVADRRSDAPAVATAEAAGAHVVVMPAGVTDPAAAPDVVSTLHERAGHPTVFAGATFRALSDPEWTVRAAQGGWQLPHGGQRPFDGHRWTALYGAPGAPVLGVLGEQDPAATVQRAEQLADSYDGLGDEPVSPALEVIATVAAGDPGADGDYSRELPVSTLQPYVDAARRAGMPVVLDLQPGRADFLSQAKRYESLLREPNVWLALDPEWRLGPDQVPLRQIGSVSADEVDRVSSWLAGLVRQHGLPPKALVLHQFRLSMIQDRASLTQHPELDLLVHVDGQGSQPDKQATWKALHQDAPAGVHWGWKNFIDEDTPMLTPEQTMADVTPTPSLITYQ